MNRALLVSAIVVAALGCCASLANAEEVKVDIGKFVQDTQRMDTAGDKLTLVWWIPTEYWEESFRQAAMTEEQKAGFLDSVKEYTVVAIVDGELNPFGPSKWRLADDIRKDLSIQLDDGEVIAPLPEGEIADGTRALLQAMKPAMANMLGNFGTGLEFICLPGNDDAGNRLLDPRSDRRFSIKYRDKVYDWRLPLGSLLAPKYDAATQERFPGNYQFNPFTGGKLTEDAPAK